MSPAITCGSVATANSGATPADTQSVPKSLAERLSRNPNRDAILASLSDDDAVALEYDWQFWARPKQLEAFASTLRILLILAGRGWGKTRTGAQWVIDKAWQPGRIIHLVAETAADARDVMIEGESGILACSPPWFRPTYKSSLRRIEWPNGSYALAFNAREWDALRGPQCHYGWVDELAKFRYDSKCWDQFELGLRLGDNPQALVTTTPKPTRLVKSLVADTDCHVTTGHTFENSANLAPTFIQRLEKRYSGTRLGRQELAAEILSDAAGALWKREWFDDHRCDAVPELQRVVVGVDPAFSDGTTGAAECGIVAAGLDIHSNVYVLADWSGQMSSAKWARRVVDAYHHHEANTLAVEMNMAPDLVRRTIQAVGPTVPIEKVRARRGKYTRAEPVAALYEQGRVHHVGAMPELEDQCCVWEPGEGQASPDRLDALVWAITALVKPNVPGAYGKVRGIRGPARRV